MHTFKTMFRSPRFVVGFVLVLTVVLYAIIYPMINTDDPKADRATNPLYGKTEELRAAIADKDDEKIFAQLSALEAEGNETMNAVLAEVRKAMESGGLAKALSGSKQVKRTNPLYDEFAALRTALGADAGVPADVEAAKAELARLDAHHQSVLAASEAVKAGGAAADIADEAVRAEFAEVTDAAGADKAVKNHEATYKWVLEIGTRLEAGGHEEAQTALSEIQKTTLIPKDGPPRPGFPFGTDSLSRNIFLEMAYGARLSLLVGLIAGLVATLIGLIIGLLAGYIGGFVDNLLTTITNIFIVIPSMIVLILIAVALGQIREGWITGLVIGLTAWPWTARAVRAQTTSLRYRDHVNMARITGYGTGRIILTEILPYIASYVVMAFILQVASGIMSEATLAILGLGNPTAISLGRMINWAMQYEAIRSGRWWQFIPVAGAIAMITFGLYMMNSGMDQVFNPKIRS